MFSSFSQRPSANWINTSQTQTAQIQREGAGVFGIPGDRRGWDCQNCAQSLPHVLVMGRGELQ